MKRCPTCNKTFSDPNLSFCLDDGTPLLRVVEPLDPAQEEETIVTPSTGSRTDGQTRPAYLPPGGYVPPGTPPGKQGRRKAWPWIIAILALILVLLAGLGFAAAIFIPSMLRASNENSSNFNRNVDPGNSNANQDSNSNAENTDRGANENSDAAETPPPTSESDVLSTLTDLEHDWTVANINADKKKLSRILADDYVGTLPDGSPQGKADYLRTITRNTSIQKWEFDDLEVSLRGDRASLTGLFRIEVKNSLGEIEPRTFSFTDKFVWRDNRWQAVSSEVTPVPEASGQKVEV